MSGILKVGGSELINDNGGSGSLQWGTGVPSDTIIQVKSATFNGYQSIGTSIDDVTNLSCSMTIASGNKVLIFANVNTGLGVDDYGAVYITDGSNNIIYQNSTGTGNQINSSIAITPYDTASPGVYLTSNNSFNYLWTPNTTSIVVKARGQVTYGGNMYINGMESTANASHVIRGTSTLTIFEVQA